MSPVVFLLIVSLIVIAMCSTRDGLVNRPELVKTVLRSPPLVPLTRSARIDGHPAAPYRASDDRGVSDLFYAGAYDAMGLGREPTGSTLDDGLPPAWDLPDAGGVQAAPVLLPEDLGRGEAYSDWRAARITESAIYAGAAGTSRRVTSVGPEIAGSLSDAARFAVDPVPADRRLLSGVGTMPAGYRPVSTYVPDHEPLVS